MDQEYDQRQHDIDLMELSQPVVSVLIPAFNHEEYIRECLESVKASDYPKIELVLLDDGSQDETYGIAKHWIEKNKNSFVNATCKRQKNSGICETLNNLILLSSGKFVVALASDDQLLPNGISAQVHCALNTQADLVLSDAELINENGELISDSALKYFGKKPAILKSENLLHLDILLNWSPPYQHQFIKRELFDSLGFYDTKFAIEDLDFCLRNVFHSKMVLIPEKTWKYRIRISNRVTPGLKKDEILSDVKKIYQKYLPVSKGFEKFIVKSIIKAEQSSESEKLISATLAHYILSLGRLYLKLSNKIFY